MQQKTRTYRYRTFEDDFVDSGNQRFELPEGFEWVREGALRRAASGALYGAALACAQAYLRLHLHWRVENRAVLGRRRGRGFVLYCNHTQPVGDAFAPEVAVFPARIYVVASPANLGIPHLGKLLPTAGALPVPSTVAGMKKFRDAIRRRLREGSAVVVYPEAHVWPYCTKIRPFPATSFSFAVENDVPAYSMTTTYQRRKAGGAPRAIAYLDGPFWPDGSLSKKAAREKLHDEVFAAMERRSRQSDCEYVRYEKAQGAGEAGDAR